MDFKDMLEKVKGHIDENVRGLAVTLEDQGKEIKAQGETSAETVKKIKEFEDNLMKSSKDLEELKNTLEKENVKNGRRGLFGLGGSEDMESKSAGQRFIESEEYSLMVKSKDQRGAVLELGGRFGRKAGLFDMAAPAGGIGFAVPYRAPEIYVPDRKMQIRDLMNVVKLTDTDAVQYIREVGFTQHMVRITAAAGGTLRLENGTGFRNGQVYSVRRQAPYAIVGQVTLTADPVRVGGGSVSYYTVSYTVNSGEVREGDFLVSGHTIPATRMGDIKPDLGFDLSLKTQSVVTLAGTVTIPRQAVMDNNRLRNYIDTKLEYSLMLAEEQQLLYGAGNDQEIPGILMDADRQTYDWSQGEAGDTKIDAVRRAFTRVLLADYEPNGVVMHPSDWEDIELQKGSDGHYIWVNVGTKNDPRLWGVPIVATRAVNEGTAVAGAWGLGGTLYDREEAIIRIFEQHADYAKRNLALLLGEERVAATWERPESFVEITFDDAPTVPNSVQAE